MRCNLLVCYLLVTVIPSQLFADSNFQILQILKEMPRGGGYATNKTAHTKLLESFRIEGDMPIIVPDVAKPSYCSGATYLVLLKLLAQTGTLEQPNLYDWSKLTPKGKDGHGVWGRWNANGPGTARLFFETGAGYNFNSFEHAKAGDFLKIFWTEAVGKKERGHSVIYLKHTDTDITFWSSNTPDGFGIKTVSRNSVKNVIFSRLLYPARLFSNIPEADKYLASLLVTESSYAEAMEKSGVKTSIVAENIKEE